jgi:hypothetical protein
LPVPRPIMAANMSQGLAADPKAAEEDLAEYLPA